MSQRAAGSTVHHPQGYPPKVEAKPMAQRLESLEGRTICLLDCRFDNTGPFLDQVQAWFAEHMPSVDTRVVQMRESWKEDPEALARIKTLGDGAIAAVGL
ncbi:MAG: hypothetical protein GEV03_10895 [Streptosporangiales bacterium]|nr:hypothetical protein [Streptosporangiales bacterium]